MVEPVTSSALTALEGLGSGSGGAAGGLGLRLQRRLTAAAGVIDTQTLHRHEAVTAGLAGRLLQRLALPEQQLTRYQMGAAEPGAIAQSVQRFQRQERLPTGGDRSWVQRLPVSGGEATAGVEPGRSASTVSEPFGLAAAAPQAVVEPAASTGSDTATPGGTFRIQRRASSLAGAALSPSAASPRLTADTPNRGGAAAYSPTADNLALGESGQTFSPAVGGAYPTAATGSSLAEDLALAAAQSSAANPGGDLGQSPSVSDAPPVVLVQPQPMQPPTGDGPTTPLPLLRRYTLAEVMAPAPLRSAPAWPRAAGGGPTVQRSPDHQSRGPLTQLRSPAIAQILRPMSITASMQRPTASPTPASESDPLPLAEGTRAWFAAAPPALPLVQRSPLPAAPLAQGTPLGSPFPPPGSPPPLPLALRAIAPESTLQRQTTETAVAEPSSAPPAPAPVGAAAPAMDAADMADQVSRILSRQLAVERERRGLGL
ncbi:hypothetical protein PGN35_008975 [Nodosilinea sp. PGN35]|uniref:hypothetical protein n=1 Tax=Nodosilinea sp. PGN35 TaxID=3020489 RepID=UPI0023B27476|nr:hypothetical protein [Nodosilinea sp. TSF1-S3]MDF0367888.1 hypothetical protein [Nodosilinea sp. TSF1-S3]